MKSISRGLLIIACLIVSATLPGCRAACRDLPPRVEIALRWDGVAVTAATIQAVRVTATLGTVTRQRIIDGTMLDLSATSGRFVLDLERVTPPTPPQLEVRLEAYADGASVPLLEGAGGQELSWDSCNFVTIELHPPGPRGDASSPDAMSDAAPPGRLHDGPSTPRPDLLDGPARDADGRAEPSWQFFHSIGDQIQGIWAAAPDDVWCIGTGGRVAHYQNLTWTNTELRSLLPPTGALYVYGLWGSSSTNIWAAGGDLFHYDGKRWSITPTDASFSLDLSAIAGTSANDVWAVGSEQILHFNGKSWSATQVSDVRLRGVWAAGPDQVWAVGQKNGVAVIRYFNGQDWRDVHSDSAAGGFFFAVWGAAANDIWAVGGNGRLAHFDGAGWTSVGLTAAGNLWSIWGCSPSNIWVGGSRGTILHFNGSTWQTEQLSSGNWSAIGGARCTDPWAGGGSIYRFH